MALGRALVILIQHGQYGDGGGKARSGVGVSCDVNDLSMICLLHIAFLSTTQHKGITKTVYTNLLPRVYH